MRKLLLALLWLPLAAWAQLPGGILGDVLRNLPKPAPSQPGAPARPHHAARPVAPPAWRERYIW